MTQKKLSKFDPDKEREQQRIRLYDKYIDAQILWIREPNEDTHAAFVKISDEYKRQFDR